MKSNVTDFDKVRQTRVELAELVRLHPELCKGDGCWSDNLKLLEECIMSKSKDRMKKYRDRKQSEGFKAVTVFLSLEAQRTLAELMKEDPSATMGEIISRELLNRQREEPQ